MPHSKLYAGGADSVDADIMDKGGSLQSKANSQVQALHAATIDIHLVFHHILSGKYLWLRLGVFFLQIELEIRVEAWYNIIANNPGW